MSAPHPCYEGVCHRVTKTFNPICRVFDPCHTDRAAVPDLVFSEMKFLQKEKAQPELSPQSDVAKKKRKKDHAQTKEGEISAFFTSTRPELTGRDKKALPEHASVRENKRRVRDQHSVIDMAVPTAELADKASFLGFESRGPRHGSTSYVSWSESNHAPSATLACLPIEVDTSHGRRDSELHARYKPETNKNDDPFKRPASPSTKKQGNDHIAKRFRVSLLVPSHNRTSRSHSFPQRSSSPRRPNLVDRFVRLQRTDTVCSPSSVPPSMPPHASVDVRQTQPARSQRDARPEVTANCDEHQPAESQGYSHVGDYENADAELQTSSDLGRVLQQCNETFHEQRQAATPPRRHTQQIKTSYPTHLARPQHMGGSHSASRRVPTVHFVDPPYQRPVLPNFTGPSIYEQQAQCQQQPPPHTHMEENMCQSSCPIEHSYWDGMDRTHEEQDWEGLFEEPILYGLEGSLGTFGGEEGFTATIGTGHALDLRPENDVVTRGFWRPNKLY